MDNITYDALYTPTNGDSETYSKLSSSTVQLSPSSRLRAQVQQQDKPDHVQSELNAIKNGDLKTPAYWRKMVLVALVLLMVILVLVSFALSVAAYAQALSNDRSELDKMNQEFSSVQTQLAATQINMSHILTQLDARIGNFISTVQSQNENLQIQLYCGPGQWQRVAYLNMSDPTEQCPPAWELYNTSAVRACGRPQSDALSNEQNCPVTAYPTNYQYSRVCGRVIGYQVGSPEAFSYVRNNFKLDGIVISHGIQHEYIWSYVAGLTESQPSSYYPYAKCPCNRGRQPPSSVGDNYYCESGNPNVNAMRDNLYAADKLWDGEQCEGSCCTGTKSPPWFSVRLPVPTNDSIQVHICCDQATSDEDVPIELLELYVE